MAVNMNLRRTLSSQFPSPAAASIRMDDDMMANQLIINIFITLSLHLKNKMGGVSFDRQKNQTASFGGGWRKVVIVVHSQLFKIFVFPTLFHFIKNREMEQKGDGELCECDDDIQKYAG